ncbi:hypothetical protein JX265_003008 [Neoarthrinium moseri]|uniref:C2H2-type domain-containing protein n=1 Tax=Neoarthrinium moseri TaxID=1658444 RepID=A0A9Q0ASV6_9PEZI|nr:hypothetical protein JX265_003008 [Neoarthrinium moseri]
MQSLSHAGAFDVGGAAQAASQVYEGDQSWGEFSEASLDSMLSLPPNTKSRARSLCTWKDCQYRGYTTDEKEKHALAHRQCPKEDCGWAKAKDQNQKDRHVWSSHKAWAQETGYPPQGAVCDECQQTFSRKDRLLRHKREVHAAQKRVRRPKS